MGPTTRFNPGPILIFNDPGSFWVLFFAMSLAFMWVYTFRWHRSKKPFNCLKCMTGWMTLVVCLVTGHGNIIFMMAAGVFAGALFDNLKDRYL